MYQALTKITKDIKDGAFFRSRLSSVPWKTSRKKTRPSTCWAWYRLAASTAVNSISMVFLEMAKRYGLKKVYIHAFLDGRDVLPAVPANTSRN